MFTNDLNGTRHRSLTATGSFGTYPASIKSVMHQYQDRSEARPDAFIRYDYPKLLDESREAIAKYLHVPASTCVFIPNATTGLNTVLRGLTYQPSEVIIYFATLYGACQKTVDFITETTPAESYKIDYTYPVSDQFLCSALEEAIRSLRKQGKSPKLAIFDTIVSLPGVRMPFERLTAICKQNEIYSVIDAAHCVGHIPLDLGELDADFFFSNCHKWLYVPRGCAVFYVPERNQHLMRSTLPTSHGFVPLPTEGRQINNPLPASDKSEFINNFEFVGTIDNSPYLCVPAALQWRAKLSWESKRGEEAIFAYNRTLAREAGKLVSSMLGTELMENEEGTLTQCNFSNVRLLLSFRDIAGGDLATGNKVGQWIAQVLVGEYDTFIAIILYGEAWWVRLSSQVYLSVEDFRWGAEVLQKVCARVEAGEWQNPVSRL